MIGRLAELGPDDVVLEVGPGLGVLTAYLADRVGHVHAVELDRSLERSAERRSAAAPNVDLHFGDALRLDLAALEPAPTKLVSNLPYNIATPLVVESLDRPARRRALVRDGAARGRRPLLRGAVDEGLRRRLGARPARRPSGPASTRSRARCSGRAPNVDSALVAFRAARAAATGFARVKTVVTAAFAHRRKTLANSLELAGFATRDAAAAALARDRPRAGRAGRGARAARVRRAGGSAARVKRCPRPRS